MKEVVFKAKNFFLRLKKSKVSYFFYFLGQIPRAIWFLGAIFGIFIFGVFVGASFTEYEDLNEFGFEGKDAQYYDIIKSYEELNRKYYLMMEDMEIVTDVDGWEDDPESVYSAIEGYRDRRDEILFDQGILYEKREQADLELTEYTN